MPTRAQCESPFPEQVITSGVAGSILKPPKSFSEAGENSFGRVELSPIDKYPLQPIHAGEEHGRFIEHLNQMAFGLIESPNRFIGLDTDSPVVLIVFRQAAQQARDVGCHCLASQGAKIDDARNCIFNEQNVIVPYIANARLLTYQLLPGFRD